MRDASLKSKPHVDAVGNVIDDPRQHDAFTTSWSTISFV